MHSPPAKKLLIVRIYYLRFPGMGSNMVHAVQNCVEPIMASMMAMKSMNQI